MFMAPGLRTRAVVSCITKTILIIILFASLCHCYADCTGTAASPCHCCDVNAMHYTITAPSGGGTSGPTSMSYSSSSGTCGTTPDVTETWTHALGYTFCPTEGQYTVTVTATSAGGTQTCASYTDETSDPFNLYYVNWDNDQNWCGCKGGTWLSSATYCGSLGCSGGKCCGDDGAADDFENPGSGNSCCINGVVVANNTRDSSNQYLCIDGEIYGCNGNLGGVATQDGSCARRGTWYCDGAGTGANTWKAQIAAGSDPDDCDGDNEDPFGEGHSAANANKESCVYNKVRYDQGNGIGNQNVGWKCNNWYGPYIATCSLTQNGNSFNVRTEVADEVDNAVSGGYVMRFGDYDTITDTTHYNDSSYPGTLFYNPAASSYSGIDGNEGTYGDYFDVSISWSDLATPITQEKTYYLEVGLEEGTGSNCDTQTCDTEDPNHNEGSCTASATLCVPMGYSATADSDCCPIGGTTSEYPGKDDDDGKCVRCYTSNHTQREGATGNNKCEQKCGADTECDEQDIGYSSGNFTCNDECKAIYSATNLVATAQTNKPLNSELGKITLTWTDNSNNEDGFKIERSTDGSTFTQIDTVGASITTYTDDDLEDNTVYYYRIRSYKGSYNAPYSNIASASTKDRTGPSSPELTATADNVNNEVDLSWAWSQDEIRPDVSNEGLVGRWDFEEGSGSTTHDNSGNGNDGTISGATYSTDSILGSYAINFTSNTDYIDLGTLNSDNFSTVTITGWVKFDVVGSWKRLWAKRVDSNNTIRVLTSDNNECIFSVRNGGLYPIDIYSSSSFQAGSWYHIAVTIDNVNQEAKLYLNGEVEGTDTSFTLPDVSTADFILGNTYAGGGSAPDARFDDWRVYDRVLTQDEIKNLMLVGQWHFDEGSGTAAKDASGFGNSGTLNGDPQWVDGVYGKALEFDGNDYVEVPDSASLDITDEITIEAWVKPAGQSTWGGIVVKGPHSNLARYQIFYTDTKKIRFGVTDGTTFADVYSDSALTDNQWYHIVGVYNKIEVALYINGVKQTDTHPFTQDLISTSGYNLNIGQGSSGANEFFNGTIDEVRIWRRALSAEEIQARAKYGLYRANSSSGTYTLVNGKKYEGEDLSWQSQLNVQDVSDNDAENGIAAKITDAGATGSGFIYGPYDSTLTNGKDYLAVFRIKVSDNTVTDNIFYLDINEGSGGSGRIAGPIYIKGTDFPSSNVYKDFAIPFTHDGTGNIETRLYYYDGKGETLYLDKVNVYPRENNYTDTSATDNSAPNEATGLSSTSHSTSTWSNDNTVDFSWTTATDNGDDYFYYLKAFDDEGNENNLICNGFFEESTTVGELPYCWGDWSSTGGDGVLDNSEVYSGNYSYKVRSCNAVTTEYIPVNYGSTYVLYVTGKWNTSGQSMNINIGTFNSSKSVISWSAQDITGKLNSTNWQTSKSIIYIDDSDIKYIKPHLTTNGNNNTIWYDNVRVYEVKNATVTTGLDGYAAVCDQNSGDTSSTTKNIEEGATTYTCTFPDGQSNYFHLRSVDNANNWDDTSADSGPYWIDTVDPTTTDDSDTACHGSDQTITLTPSDTLSGVASTTYCVDTAGTCNPSTSGTSVSVTCSAGSYCEKYVRYRSEDNAGNIESVKTSNLVKIDKAGPNAPTGLSPPDNNVTNDATPSFSWSAPNDVGCNGTVTEYNWTLYSDASCSNIVQTNLTSGTNITASELSDGVYYWRVRAKDGFNNWGAWSGCTKLDVDLLSPSISQVWPNTTVVDYKKTGALLVVNFTFTERNPKNYTIKLFNATDTVCEVSKTSGISGGSDIQESNSCTVGSSSGAKWFNLSVTMYDIFGRVIKNTQTDAVMIDNIPPSQVSIDIGAIVVGGKKYARGVIQLNASATDADSGIDYIEFYANNTLINTSYSAPYSVSWNTSDYNDGLYNVTAKAYDKAGNSLQSD